MAEPHESACNVLPFSTQMQSVTVLRDVRVDSHELVPKSAHHSKSQGGVALLGAMGWDEDNNKAVLKARPHASADAPGLMPGLTFPRSGLSRTSHSIFILEQQQPRKPATSLLMKISNNSCICNSCRFSDGAGTSFLNGKAYFSWQPSKPASCRVASTWRR
ncbi:unnamed protein product [Polarella glacialis]|uniref:Uncharacterized protein n=1 Tax=Polarella glacialis TaxID=89957 RepID=A0A813JB79_POLGL|nr:unnamed protein product [Polarella glacialis]CAE8672755.1 unnamed protein product [Polarella glacialis]